MKKLFTMTHKEKSLKEPDIHDFQDKFTAKKLRIKSLCHLQFSYTFQLFKVITGLFSFMNVNKAKAAVAKT